MNIAGFGNSTGSKWWRLIDPFKYLRKYGWDARIVELGGITREVCEWADVIVLSSCVDKEGIALIHEYQMEHGKKLVVDTDDFFELNEDSPFKKEHAMSQAKEVIKITMGIADMVTMTTKYLADQVRPINPNVRVLPNCMDMERWDLPKLKNTSDIIRIGWAGSITHLDDLKMVINPLKRICKEFPQVQLVFIGDMRIAPFFKGYNLDVMLGVPFEVWPAKLHGLRLDIGIAPLRDTPFNRCKSNIKMQEYAIAHVPGVYSPLIYNFRGFDGEFGHIAENEDQWYMNLRNMIVEPDLRENIRKHAYSFVRKRYDLSKNIPLWIAAYQSLTRS